ncbi:MAG: hypothetical protein Q4C47_07695, partial [Planctomycetia bacterium]|nr:hypothetical protein [Planctomycetia bacterium]
MIVMGLLALFSMIGVSFVLITSDAERSAKATFTATAEKVSSTDLLQEAAMRVFRGAPTSTWDEYPIGAHNLLTDMYGEKDAQDLVLDDALVTIGYDSDSGLLRMVAGVDRIYQLIYQAEAERLDEMVGAYELSDTLRTWYRNEFEATWRWKLVGKYLGFANGDVYQILNTFVEDSLVLKPVSLTATT